MKNQLMLILMLMLSQYASGAGGNSVGFHRTLTQAWVFSRGVGVGGGGGGGGRSESITSKHYRSCSVPVTANLVPGYPGHISHCTSQCRVAHEKPAKYPQSFKFIPSATQLPGLGASPCRTSWLAIHAVWRTVTAVGWHWLPLHSAADLAVRVLCFGRVLCVFGFQEQLYPHLPTMTTPRILIPNPCR